jgi:hypothetical protein
MNQCKILKKITCVKNMVKNDLEYFRKIFLFSDFAVLLVNPSFENLSTKKLTRRQIFQTHQLSSTIDELLTFFSFHAHLSA